jgi:hypothetical protein
MEHLYLRDKKNKICGLLYMFHLIISLSHFAGLAGANIMERLRNAPIDSDNPQNGQILLDFEDGMGDRIQVFIA